MKQVELVDLISQFRMTIYEHFPYLAPYVYSLTPVERPGLGTMAVDKYGKMYYDPAWCETLTLEQGGYVVCHEALHLILRHCHRAPKIVGDHPTAQESRDLNIAMDVVVWEFMEAIAHLAPEGGVTFDKAKEKWPEIERNMTVEKLYSIINESRKSPPPPDLPIRGDDFGLKGDESQPPQQDEEQGRGSSEQESPEGDKKDDGKGRGQGGEGEQEGKGSGDDVEDDGFRPVGGGSAADGQPRDYEEEPDPNWDAFREDRLLEMVEQKIEELEEDRQWTRHHLPGTLPAELKRVIKSKLRPQPNPWDQLRATVARCAANHKGAPDYTYQRRNRRQDSSPDLPLLKGVKKYMPKAVVVVDTSGSMTAGCLRKAIGVIKQGLKALGEVPVITADAQVGQDIRVTRVPDDFVFVGGGGTDMRIPLAHSEEKYSPDVTVLVTDTYTPWPDRPLKGQLIVAATQDGDVPSWATKVRIPDDPTKESLDDE